MSTAPLSSTWDDGLKLVSFCPVCNNSFSRTEAQLLGKQGETHLLHVQCRKCHNATLVLVLVNQVGASSVGLVTDLTYEDVLRFKAAPAISVNDVIDVHTLLREVDWVQRLGHRTRERVAKVAHRHVKQTQQALLS